MKFFKEIFQHSWKSICLIGIVNKYESSNCYWSIIVLTVGLKKQLKLISLFYPWIDLSRNRKEPFPDIAHSQHWPAKHTATTIIYLAFIWTVRSLAIAHSQHWPAKYNNTTKIYPSLAIKHSRYWPVNYTSTTVTNGPSCELKQKKIQFSVLPGKKLSLVPKKWLKYW